MKFAFRSGAGILYYYLENVANILKENTNIQYYLDDISS